MLVKKRLDEDLDRFHLFSGNINPLRDDGFLVDIRKSRFPTQTGSSVLNESEYGQAFTDYIERIFADKAEGKLFSFILLNRKQDKFSYCK